LAGKILAGKILAGKILAGKILAGKILAIKFFIGFLNENKLTFGGKDFYRKRFWKEKNQIT
jgi:hypothetical protein